MQSYSELLTEPHVTAVYNHLQIDGLVEVRHGDDLHFSVLPDGSRIDQEACKHWLTLQSKAMLVIRRLTNDVKLSVGPILRNIDWDEAWVPFLMADKLIESRSS